MTTMQNARAKKSRSVRMTAVLVSAAAALAAAGVGTAAAAVSAERSKLFTSAEPDNNAVMEDVARRVMAVGPPGYQARIGNDHRVKRTAAGLADLATERPMTGRDQYEAGSNTKTFTAVLILQLVDRKQVELDAPVSKYLPGVVPNGENITVRMLLNHTSGLYSYTDDPDLFSDLETNPQHVHTDQELLAIAAKGEPYFEPGAGWHYSNTNYILLGMIAQKLTGKSMPVLVKQRITDPLGMEHTYYANPRAVDTGPGYAHGYGVKFAGPTPVYVDVSRWTLGWAGAAGAVISSTDNLATFFSAVLQGKLFSKAQLEEMKTTVALPEGYPVKGGYGLGLMRLESPCGTVWGHGGDTIGHHSSAMATADGRNTVMTDANAEPFDAEPNDGWDRYYKVIIAADAAAICQLLGKPLPDSVLDDLHSVAPALATAN